MSECIHYAGELAWIDDAVAGLVPVRVVRVIEHGPTRYVDVTVTAQRASYTVGETRGLVFGSVIPRSDVCRHVDCGAARIRVYGTWTWAPPRVAADWRMTG